MKEKLQRALAFLRTDIWRIRARSLPPSRSLLIRQLQVILLAMRGFSADKCSLRASALTFYSILSIVPAFAMAFGVAKGFGLEKLLEERLVTALSAHEDVATRVIEFSRSLLENTRGGVMAAVGVAVLFWTVIKVLGNIEKSFNEIWGLRSGRPLARKFADYLSMMLICPVLLVLSSGATVVLTSGVEAILQRVAFLGFLGPLILALLKLVPYCIGWGLFAFLYVFMPNTKVNLKSALLAGVVAGTLYQVVQWIYISFQIGVTRYSAIYGSFAVLPLFLIWLQLSWLIVLFGAELAFAHQNVETYEFEPDCLRASRSFRRLIALRITQMLVRSFAEGHPPRTAAEISRELGVPIRLANETLYELTEARVLSEAAARDGGEAAYQPARAISALTIAYVVEALERRGIEDIPLEDSQELHRIEACLGEFAEAVHRSPANIPLADV